MAAQRPPESVADGEGVVSGGTAHLLGAALVVAFLTVIGKEAKGISFGGRPGTSGADVTARVGTPVSE
ncbi:MAG: hypothetical protein J0I34_30525 [Pseudonocardia sp.]|uniref:hypothetical protein n=1 Tax=Pseudonocardia sp. TaxID=60912 RepID=UPI001ACB8BB7|nr:hypothetical protein [Pseudonocardia sp.]MBN9113108.1 hypothetical protein [Pseudonocardia sp.]